MLPQERCIRGLVQVANTASDTRKLISRQKQASVSRFENEAELT